MSDVPAYAVRTEADKLAIEQGCYWDQSKANNICAFAELHFKPQYVKGQFKLLEWQKRFLQSLYGWRNKDGTKRFSFANLHCPKKVGKNLLVCIVAKFELLHSEEKSPLVIVGAATLENATQIYDELKYSLDHSVFAPFYRKWDNTKKIKFPALNATFKTYSFGNKSHGENATCCILNELHSHENAVLYESFREAGCARNSVTICISTCGKDMMHFYHDIYQKSKNILEGKDLDITHYAEVWEMDQDGNPEDEAQWHKAIPGLSEEKSFTIAKFRNQLISAKASKTDWLNFQKLRLNRWLRETDKSYLDVNDFHNFYIDEPDLTGLQIFLGVDLSSSVDPSSVSLVAKMPDGKYYIRSWAWICREGVEKRRDVSANLPHYDQFIRDGDMVETQGSMIDGRLIRNFILDLCAKYEVKQVNFDPASAYMMMHEIEQEGYKVARVNPTPKWMNDPCREFEKCYRAGQICHSCKGNYLKYNFSNCVVETNSWDEITISKKKKQDIIDGAYAVLLAMFSAMTYTEMTGFIKY